MANNGQPKKTFYQQLELLSQGEGTSPQVRTDAAPANKYFTASDIGISDKALKYLDPNNIPLDASQAKAQVSQNQAWYSQAFNGIVGGALSGLATAIEDFSYIPNLLGNDFESNAVADLMKEIKHSIHEDMPIYRSSDNLWSFDGGAFVWESLRGILDSAVGFGIPGGAIGKVLGYAGKMGKLARLSNKLARISPKLGAYARVLGSNKFVQEAAHSLGTGFVMNDLEGTMMGVELYENLISQGISKEEAEQRASDFKFRNRMFAITDAIGVYGMFKGGVAGGSRGLMKERSFGQFIKNQATLSADNLVLQGFKESLEEIGQNVLQREGEYQAKKAEGFDTKDLTDATNLEGRIEDFALSSQAMYEGMLGFFGGGPQRIFSGLVAGEFKKENIDKHNKRYKEQQDYIKEMKKTLGEFVNSQSELDQLKTDAFKSGRADLDERLNAIEFANILMKNFQMGTTEALEASLEDIAGYSEEEAAEKQLDKNYRENAQKRLKQLRDAERSWNKYNGMLNQTEIFGNRLTRNRRLDELAATEEGITEARTSLEKELGILTGSLGKVTVEEKDGKDTIVREVPITLTAEEVASGVPNIKPANKEAEAKINEAIDRARKLPEFGDWKNAQSRKENVEQALKVNEEEYTKIAGPDHQDSLIAQRDKIIDFRKRIKEAKTEEEVNKIKDELLTKYKDKLPIEAILGLVGETMERGKEIAKADTSKKNKEKRDAAATEAATGQNPKEVEEEEESGLTEEEEELAEEEIALLPFDRKNNKKGDELFDADGNSLGVITAVTVDGRNKKIKSVKVGKKTYYAKDLKKLFTKGKRVTAQPEDVDPLDEFFGPRQEPEIEEGEPLSKEQKGRIEEGVEKTKTRVKHEALIQEFIDTLEERKKLIAIDSIQIKDTLAYLDELLKSVEELSGIEVERILQHVERLEALIETKSTAKTKRGKRIRNAADQIKNQLRGEKTLINDIANRIRTLSEEVSQLEQIQKDLQNQINYYNNLLADENFETLSEKELKEKIGIIEKKQSTLRRLISYIKNLISDSLKFIKDYVNITTKAVNALEKFKKDNSFKVLDAKELRAVIEGKRSFTIEEYEAFKKEFDKLTKAAEESLDALEDNEAISKKHQERLDALHAKLRKYDDQVRYLENLITKLFTKTTDTKTKSDEGAPKPKGDYSVKHKEEPTKPDIEPTQEDEESRSWEDGPPVDDSPPPTAEDEPLPEVGFSPEPSDEENIDNSKLSNADKEEAKGDLKTGQKVDDKHQVNESTIEEIEQTQEQVEDDVETSNKVQTKGKYDYKRVESGSNIFAQLHRKFKQIINRFGVSRKDVDEELSDSISLATLDPNKIKVGTEITLKVDNEYEGEIYIPGDPEKNTVSWQAFKAEIEKGSDEYNQNVPIAIIVDGEVVAHVHTTEWIKPENVYGDVIADRKNSERIRAAVLNSGPKGVKTKVTERTNGVLFKVSEPILVSEAYPKDIKMAVGKSSEELKLDNGDVINNRNLINTGSFIPGATYALIPVGKDGLLAYPVINQQVGQHTEIKATIMAALRLYLAGETTPLTTQINDKLGIDILTAAGLSDYLGNFINDYDIGEADSLKDFLKAVRMPTGRYFFNSKGGNFSFSKGGNVGHSWVSPNTDKEKHEEYLERIEEMLDNFYLQTDINKLEANKEVLLIVDGELKSMGSYRDYVQTTSETSTKGFNIGTEAKPNWVYTIHPVITFDDSFVGKPTISEESNLENTSSKAETISDKEYNDFIDKNKVSEERLSSLVNKTKAGESLSAREQAMFSARVTEINERLKKEVVVEEVITDKDKIIWGHPGIGKTTARKSNKNIIDFDSDYKPQINKKYGLKEGFAALNKWRKDNPELWEKEIKALWIKAKQESKNTGKQLFVSDMLMLREFAKDFDKIINVSSETFVSRTKQRDDYTEGKTEEWKGNIDEVLQNVEPSKVFTTDKYLSELLPNNEEVSYKDQKVSELKAELKSRGLKVTGKKDELITRLEENDKKPKEEKKPVLSAEEKAKRIAEIRARRKINPDLPQVSQIATPLTQAEKDEISLYSTLIKELGHPKQKAIVESLITRVLMKAYKLKKGENFKASEAYAELEKGIKDSLADTEELLVLLPGDPTELANKAEFELILKHFSKLTEIANAKLSAQGILDVKTKKSTTKGNQEEEINELEKLSYQEDKSITRNPKDTVSIRFKRFLSAVTYLKKNEDGDLVPVKNYLGDNKLVGFDTVYNTIQDLLYGREPEFDELIAVLKSQKDKDGKYSISWIPSLIEMLENADIRTQHEFVVASTKHLVKMTHIQYFIRDGQYTMRTVDADSGSKAQALRSEWSANMKKNGLLVINPNNPSEYIYNEEKIKDLVNQFNSMVEAMDMETDKLDKDGNPVLRNGKPVKVKAGSKNISNSVIRNWLKEFGIELDAYTISELRKRGISPTTKAEPLNFKALFTHKDGLFRILNDYVRTIGGESEFDKNPIKRNTIIQQLAKFVANRTDNKHASSFTNNKKIVPSYAQNKYLIDRIRLLTTDLSLVEDLLNTSFSEESEFLKSIVNFEEKNGQIKVLSFKTEGQKGYDVLRKLEASYAAFNPLKSLKEKIKENMELNKRSEADHEIYKLGEFMANIAKGVTKFLYPTTSDKTTSMRIMLPYHAFQMDSKGNLHPDEFIYLFKSLVLPEIRRIKAYQAKGKKTEVAGYDAGAEQFHIFPELNTIEGIFSPVDGSLHPDAENADSDMHKKIIAKLNEYMTSLVNEKLADWKEFGIGETVVDEKDPKKSKFMAFIDKGYKKTRHLSNKDPNITLKNVATDMVGNYLLANMSIYQAFIGDPAQFYKPSEEVRGTFESFLADKFPGQELSVERKLELKKAFFNKRAEDTFINIGKRLAGDIAPGLDLSGAKNSNIKYLFLQDRKSQSLALEYYKKLNIKGIGDYTKIEGTDAQEFTTLAEHLEVLKMLGRVDEEDITRIEEASKTNTLSDLDLGLILQPMKPVYVNTIVDKDRDLARRVYVKSSSFPLIPQLTKGLAIDNLRVLMEKNNIDRAAFGTAVKVGNTSSPLNIFKWTQDDKNFITNEEYAELSKEDKATYHQSDALYEDLTVDDTNSLIVPRTGFRIQQDVPYKESKQEINLVTQSSKLLLVNMLKEKFNVSWAKEKIKGSDLQDKYHETFSELYEIAVADLIDSVTIPRQNRPGVYTLDIEKLRRTLIEEAESRGYPTSTIEAIKLDNNLKGLIFSSDSHRFESLFNSIVENRVIKQKLPGSSWVLGTEEGFNGKVLIGEDGQRVVDKSSGIIYTKNWSGKLQPQNENSPTEVLMPSRFRDNSGNLIDLWEKDSKGKHIWLNDDLTLNEDKFDNDTLRLFGMRIPNQGPNSTANIRVVGFLPHKMGDLILSSRDFTIQMGSDFDVDKLYTYMYYTFIDNTGKIRRFNEASANEYIENAIQELDKTLTKAFKEGEIKLDNKSKKTTDAIVKDLIADVRGVDTAEELTKDEALEEEEFLNFENWKERKLTKLRNRLEKSTRKKVLKNLLVEIHLTVAQSSNQRVQSQMAEPIGFWELSEIAKDIESLRKGRSTKAMFTGLSDTYQRRKYINATAGKDGVGVFSLDNVFNALAQGKELAFIENYTKDFVKIYLSVTFGDKTTINGDLSDETIIGDLETFKSEIIAAYQSAAVDNEKEQLLDKLNINKHTFEVIKLLNQLGFSEEVPYFISQDIIHDFIRESNKLSSVSSDFKGDVASEAYRIVSKRYAEKSKTPYDPFKHSKLADKGVRGKGGLRELIELGESAPDYHISQLAILDKFEKLSNHGRKLGELQSAINADSAGIGKSYVESVAKQKQADDIILNSGKPITKIENATSLMFKKKDGKKLRTINGLAIEYGIKLNNDLWSSIIPWGEKSFTKDIDGIFAEIERIIPGESLTMSQRAELRLAIINDARSFLYGNRDNNIFGEESINWQRVQYFIDAKDSKSGITNMSIASVFEALKNNPDLDYISKNSFLSLLTTRIEAVNSWLPSHIEFNATTLENEDDSEIYEAIIDMLTSDNQPPLNPKKDGKYVLLNGKIYTPSLLAQDLIAYQYLKGGKQGAGDFLKFIPPAYIYKMGLVENLTNTNFNSDEVFGNRNRRKLTKDNYFDVSVFTKQWAQHNAYRFKQIDRSGIKPIGKDSKTMRGITEFVLAGPNVEEMGQVTEASSETSGRIEYPVFLSHLVDQKTNTWHIYKYNGKTYQRIDTLGKSSFAEYNSEIKTHSSQQTSAIRTQRTAQLETITTRTKPPIEEAEDPVKAPPVVEEENTLFPNKATFVKDGRKEVARILANLRFEDDHHQLIADFLLDNIDNLQDDLVVRYLDEPSSTYNAHLYYASVEGKSAGEIGLATPKFLNELKQDGKIGNITLEEAYLHEIVHAFTQQRVNRFNLNKESVTRKERILIERIAGQRQSVREKIKRGELIHLGYKPEDLIEADRQYASKKSVSEELFDRYYPLMNDNEFITGMSTNSIFKDKMKQIPIFKKGNMYEAVMDTIAALLKAMGLGKFDNVADFVLRDILELTSIGPVNTGDVTSVIEEHIEELEDFDDTLNYYTPTYMWHGAQYRFLSNEEGQIVRAEYRQKSNEDWIIMKGNQDKAFKRYEEILKGDVPTVDDLNTLAKEEKDLQDSSSNAAQNSFTFSDGVTINTGNINLSGEQRDALQEMVDAVEQGLPDYTLRGYAGTGKSTVVGFLVDYYKIKKRNKKILFAAPVHKAKAVLLGFLFKKGHTSSVPMTLAKSLNIKYVDGKWQPGSNHKIPVNGIYVLDEASMASESDLSYLKELAAKQGTTVIRMGDPAQIPPVKSSRAPKLYQSSGVQILQGRGRELTQVHRQGMKNPLLNKLTKLREEISNLTPNFEFKTWLDPETGEGYTHINNISEWYKKIEAAFASDEMKEDPLTNRIVAYTNAAVHEYNELAKQAMNPGSEPYAVGDLIMGYAQSGLDPLIHNGNDYQIVASEKIETSHIFDMPNANTGAVDARKKVAIHGYRIQLKPLLPKSTREAILATEGGVNELAFLERPITVTVVDTNNSNNQALFEAIYEIKVFSENRKFPWNTRKKYVNDYGSFTTKFPMPEDLMKKQGEPVTTLSLLKQSKPHLFRKNEEGVIPFKEQGYHKFEKNIGYGYAVTGHKAQGSTYTRVFVDVENILNTRKTPVYDQDNKVVAYEHNNILYVAASRASHEVIGFHTGGETVAPTGELIGEVTETITFGEQGDLFSGKKDISEMQARVTKKIAEVQKGSRAEIHVPKEKVKSRQATQYIGMGATNSSTDKYYKIYKEEGVANTGKYTPKDVVWVSVNGNRPGRVVPINSKGEAVGAYANLDKAMAAGATIIADTKAHILKSRKYNVGEEAVARYLHKKGYKRVGETGVWKPAIKPTKTKPTIDLSKEWRGDLEKRPVYTEEGVNTMRTNAAKSNEHFGNPFSEAGYGNTVKVPSIEIAVTAYKEWLLTGYTQWLNEDGEASEFAGNTEQRAWILDQINQGKLDGVKLLYAGKSAARGKGMHPTALAEVVEEIRTNEAPPWVSQLALPYPSGNKIKDGVLDVFNSNPKLAKIGTPEQYSQYLNTVFPDSELKNIVYHGTMRDFKQLEVGHIPVTPGTVTKGYDNNEVNLLWFGAKDQAEMYAGKQIDFTQLTPKEIEEWENEKKKSGLTTSKVFPVMIDTSNVFDPKNPEHIKLFESSIASSTDKVFIEDTISTLQKEGNWYTLEKYFPEIQKHGFRGIKTLETNDYGSISENIGVSSNDLIHQLGSEKDIEGFKDFNNKSNQGSIEYNPYPSDAEVEELIKNCKGSKGSGKATKGSNPKAQSGANLSKNTTFGKWSIAKDLKGMPTHAQGGVDIKVDGGKVSFGKGNSRIHAKNGLLITKENCCN